MTAGPLPRLPDEVARALVDAPPGRRIEVAASGIAFSALAWGGASWRPLLLVHGVTASAAIWWRVGPALAASRRYVVALDLPGHGRTGRWLGHHRPRDNAVDVAAFVRSAGMERGDLQVVGHSWGAVTVAALPIAGLRPATVVLLDPPALPHSLISALLEDPTERTYDDLEEARAAVRAANPGWDARDVLAKAEALTEVDEEAARAVLLDNGDWDGGLADLADPAAAGLDVWLIRGDPAAGGYLPDEAVPAFIARLGADHVITLAGAPHSPQRTHPEATTAALLRALDGGSG
jgi:pimeloyl-ACP methyl ester carboxylesterase